jgi:thiamine kinase-like enzyme
MDMQTETFAMKRATALGISVPKCIAVGCIVDKYSFSYMIMEFIKGKEFTDLADTLSYDKKVAFGRKLREITDKMNTPCESFNGIDVINDKGRYRRWDKYSAAFRQERLNYIKTHDYGEKVFVHGDLCSDNILVADDDQLFIIDFADAVTAPIIYEQAHVASELFQFDKAFLTGYFGEYNTEWLADLCFNGLLIHDFGGDIVEQHVAKSEEITSLKILHQRLYGLIAKQ